MRLDFNVLWVEDLQANVQAQKEKLERLIRNEGFRLRVQFASSVEEASKYLSDDIFGDHIDLILMDYNLGAGPNGDAGLVEVRNRMRYKEIIFYSAQADNLRDILKATNVEGVYLSIRDDIPDTAGGVFEALIKKVLDIDHSRGIVMGTTSDIDYLINQCLIRVFNNSNEDTKSKSLKIVQGRVKEKRKSFDEDAAKVEAITHVSDLLDKHNIYTSIDRLNLLRKIFSANRVFTEKCETMKAYTSTYPKRNDLAHVRVQIEGFSRKLFNRNNEELTSDEMRKLRLELLEYQEFFEKLFESVIDSGQQRAD